MKNQATEGPASEWLLLPDDLLRHLVATLHMSALRSLSRVDKRLRKLCREWWDKQDGKGVLLHLADGDYTTAPMFQRTHRQFDLLATDGRTVATLSKNYNGDAPENGENASVVELWRAAGGRLPTKFPGARAEPIPGEQGLPHINNTIRLPLLGIDGRPSDVMDLAVHDGILLASGPPGEAKVSVWDVRGSQAAPRAATADSSITPGSADGLGPTDTPACSLAVPEGNCHSIEIQAGRIFLGGRPAAPPQPQALGWGQQAEEAMRAYAEAEAATYRAHPSWAMSIQADVAFM